MRFRARRSAPMALLAFVAMTSLVGMDCDNDASPRGTTPVDGPCAKDSDCIGDLVCEGSRCTLARCAGPDGKLVANRYICLGAGEKCLGSTLPCCSDECEDNARRRHNPTGEPRLFLECNKESGTCQLPTTAPPRTPDAGGASLVCSKGGSGATCASDDQCCSPNGCSSTGQSAAICCPWYGGECNDTSDCCAGAACVGGGCCWPCTVPGLYGACDDNCGACAKGTSCCSPLGAGCSSDDHCCDGLKCASWGECLP